MMLIVDTNILFSFFNERSKARELSLLPDLELHSPYFSIDELVEHKS
jgi:predicted nucleic acid-binding protein